MSPHQLPDPGTAITFLNSDPAGADVIRHGVAAGPAVHDPRTDRDWIPVVCPDTGRVLVHELLVVEDSGPPRVARIPKTPDGVRDAVLRWTCCVAMLADRPRTPWAEIETILADLLTKLSPMRYTMRALNDADPSGELAAVVMALSEAMWHLQAGEVRATREAIAAGVNALVRYLTAD